MHGLPNTKGLAYYRVQIAQAGSSTSRSSFEATAAVAAAQTALAIANPSTSFTLETQNQLLLSQITDCRNFVREALDSLPSEKDIHARQERTRKSRDEGAIVDSRFLSERLDGILGGIRNASDSLKGSSVSVKKSISTGGKGAIGKGSAYTGWPVTILDAKLFDPPLPDNLSLDITIQDAAIVTELRLLDFIHPPSSSSGGGSVQPFSALDAVQHLGLGGFGFREKLTSAFKGRKSHDGGDGSEGEEVFSYKGMEVKVKEKIRVESQDPSLMSLMSKLGALEHNVVMSRTSLGIVMRDASVLI